jgi:hypothetical protein
MHIIKKNKPYYFRMKKLVFLLFLLILACSIFAEEFYPTTVASLDTQVRLWGDGEVSGLKAGQEATLQTLTFQESEFQKVTVVKEVLYINGKEILPEYILDEFSNKYVKFTIPENGSFEYELIADIEIDALIHKMNDYVIGQSPEEFNIFLARSETVESDSSEILTVAAHKLSSNNFLETLDETVFWVNDYVEYAKDNEFQFYYLQQRTSIETLLSKKGVCDEFSNLAAGLLRAKGIPTRLAIGITFDGIQWGTHAWVEVHHKDLGWIPTDPTFRESGFVDATHIKLGSFSDVSLSLAKAIYPDNATISFNTQKLPEVTVKNKEYFSQVTITADNQQLLTNQWNKLKLKVKNNGDSIITAPIIAAANESKRLGITKVACLATNTDCLYIEETKKSIVLGPHEEKEVEFNFYPAIELTEFELINTTLFFDSLSAPFEKGIAIRMGEPLDNGTVTVVDLTPITTAQKLMLEILIGNNKPIPRSITINVTGDDQNYNWTETLTSFELRSFRKEVPLESEEYNVTIETDSEIYTQTIYPIISTVSLPKIPPNTVIVQKIPNKGSEDVIETVIENPELLMLASLIIVVFVLLILFAVRKRYV